MLRALRAIVASAALMASGAAAAQRMAGFEKLAAGSDTIVMRVPGWMNGSIKSDMITGKVRRAALGNSKAFGLYGVTVGGAERYGHFSFDVEGAAIDGALAADCIYDRTERQVGIGDLTISQPLRPMLLRCRFFRGGEVVGGLEIMAAPRTAALFQPTRRTGHVEIAGTALTIESEHRVKGGRLSSDMPLGYRFVDVEGTDVGGVDATGFSKRVLAVPASGAARLAAAAAGIALSVFWDPGDTDD